MVTSYGPNSCPTVAVEISGVTKNIPQEIPLPDAEELERKTLIINLPRKTSKKWNA
jgi:hypothetical protein